MADAILVGGGGGGAYSDDVTATKAQVLSGRTAVTSDSDDEIVAGTMPNNGAVSATLGINGSYTIPKGYHDGNGTVSQSITTKGVATYYATTSDQVISAGQYLSGAQTIKKLTQTNLTGANIKPGVTISINNGNADVWSVASTMTSKAAATYYAATSDQTIAAGQYLSGAQTIKAVSQENLAAANIKKGVTVYVKNGNGNLYAVTGTWEGYVAEDTDLYYRGSNIAAFSQYGETTYKKATFDSGQITWTGATGNSGHVGYALGSTQKAINGLMYSSLTITGNLYLQANVSSSYGYGLYVYVDLMDASDDYGSLSSYKCRLGTYTYTNTTNPITLSSISVPLTKQGVTGYVRIWFQGFYKTSSGGVNTTLGYSLGQSSANPASITRIQLVA